ncbi:hypothetical protein IFU39_16610 [Paenibacillus sp. CFBP 13594]|uniref:hypothetical protein n=1 Tax=Paenibacillus sp. CFBP 13594 TaxID=2774037 RepID=UPI001787728D|nr:hypothetical protein [Paenibacillus sp. CFBP 13594]MBD8839436.1 hypothetical protein [Paenibacillus sp. CFBP 13594]
MFKSAEITLNTPGKVELFDKLLHNKGKVNEELIQKIQNTPTIPRRKKLND